MNITERSNTQLQYNDRIKIKSNGQLGTIKNVSVAGSTLDVLIDGTKNKKTVRMTPGMVDKVKD